MSISIERLQRGLLDARPPCLVAITLTASFRAGRRGSASAAVWISRGGKVLIRFGLWG
jgi:hypothetical protein